MASDYSDKSLQRQYQGYWDDPYAVPSSDALEVSREVYYTDSKDPTGGARFIRDATVYTPAEVDRLEKSGLLLGKFE